MSAPVRPPLQLWAGFECTLNRVGDRQHDQLAFAGHYGRLDDLDRLAELGVRTVRYPVLWERVAAGVPEGRPWEWTDACLHRLRDLGIEPIVGLVHHGSGPLGTDLLDDGFAEGLARFAGAVAERYPWVTQFTPVNEPLTTARFSALYGAWYPHARDSRAFWRATLNQVRAVRLAMEAIRAVTPHARLVQTEDLGCTHSTSALRYQADFENERRWLAFDLLTDRLRPGHPMYAHARSLGVGSAEIAHAVGEGCPPDLIGINHYVTSERWLDERLSGYPQHTHGGNDRDLYADVEAVRVSRARLVGLRALLMDCWNRYRIPIAITESHLGCTREQQMRWLDHAWQAALGARDDGADVRAVTAWAVLGTHDWSSLVTRIQGHYEPGLFDVRAPAPRPTALAAMVRTMAHGERSAHPVLAAPGWWQRPERIAYGAAPSGAEPAGEIPGRPILVTGAGGTLGGAVVRLCAERGLACRGVRRQELDIADVSAVRELLSATGAWAVINAAGYVRVDDAEHDQARARRENVTGPTVLASACAALDLPFVTISSDLVFDGRHSSGRPYLERDPVAPLGVYGATKAEAEACVQAVHPRALVIRTAAFFGPWDEWNFVTLALRSLADGVPFATADDLVVSPTYVPDLVQATLDLLLDDERGTWHLANRDAVTWAELARRAARLAGLDASLVHAGPHARLGFVARRPAYAALASERGSLMPSLDDALARYVAERPWQRELPDTSDAALAADGPSAFTT